MSLDWLVRLMAPPMGLTCTPEDIYEASKIALQRRDRITRQRAARLAQYARNWPTAQERPRVNIIAFSREVGR